MCVIGIGMSDDVRAMGFQSCAPLSKSSGTALSGDMRHPLAEKLPPFLNLPAPLFPATCDTLSQSALLYRNSFTNHMF
jgi:hypothetical protein